MILLSTLNDPQGRFSGIKGIETLMEGIAGNYENSVVNVTKSTSTRTKKVAEKYFECIKSGKGTQGEHTLNAIKTALKYEGNFHYCDFDRLVHWQMKYPEELRRTVRNLEKKKGFVFIGRTERAFETHPDTQKITEAVMNMIISGYIGKKADMGSGTFAFDKKTCMLFSRIRGDVSDVRFLGHFLRCLKKNKIRISCMDVEGMEWETPDLHRQEIKKLGYNKWLAQFQSHKEWQRRVDYIRQVVEVLGE